MKKIIRSLVNIIIILIWVLLFYAQFERPYVSAYAQNLTPALFLTSLPHKLFSLAWMSVPFFIFILYKGRFFCWHICPVGLLQDIPPSAKKISGGRSNLYIFLFLFTASIFGFNLITLFDPLITFNRAVVSLTLSAGSCAIYSSFFFFIILSGMYKRRFWCMRLCPLGGLIDWLGIIKEKGRFDPDKRRTLTAIGSGIILGGLLKAGNIYSASPDKRLLRPPGALPEAQFKERCIRCGSCISVCPTGTLSPCFFESGIGGIFTPKLAPRTAPCEETCSRCGKVCPSQAVKAMSVEEKKEVKIGTAVIIRPQCLPWAYGKLCLICREFCPHKAVVSVRSSSGMPAPAIKEERCCGCGICENKCPARAIYVLNTGAGKKISV